MSGLFVQWTLTPQSTPEPLVACSSCSAVKPFQSSDKFRLNAQGKRLDAWLIYRCRDCGSTWNRRLFIRRPIAEIDPNLLQSLQRNDEELAKRFALDSAQLRCRAPDPAGGTAFRIQKQVLSDKTQPWQQVTIRMVLPAKLSLRLDRLLASELHRSRGQIQEMARAGILKTDSPTLRALRRMVRDQEAVTIDLTKLSDGPQIGIAAAGTKSISGPPPNCRPRRHRP